MMITLGVGDNVYSKSGNYCVIKEERIVDNDTPFVVEYIKDNKPMQEVCKSSELVLVSRGLEFDMLGG